MLKFHPVRKLKLINDITENVRDEDYFWDNFKYYRNNIDSEISIKEYANMEMKTLLRVKDPHIDLRRNRRKYVKILTTLIKS
ncbi:hypothetical protein [Pareuzebyella sediminis]|uniref:hypothetical protein n=1 Tax=Pareuzebyella sediminis TaxID=2607998 RepID=UPI0011ED3977|nr:hypothetical protein [Pareuzebyella sediminis]